LITCAGIVPRDIEPISEAQLFLFSTEIAISRLRQSASPSSIPLGL
jgi:hypothetical protein